MTKVSALFIISLVVFIQVYTIAQVPENFEFLAHNNRTTEIAQIKITDDFAIIADRFSGISIAEYDYDLRTKTRDGFRQSKLIETNDSTFHIITWDFPGGDIHTRPGFNAYSFINGSERISKLSDLFINYYYFNDVTVDSIGNFWALAFRNPFQNSNSTSHLVHMGDEEIIKEIELRLINSKLFTNSKSDIYIYEQNNSISYFDGDTITYDPQLSEFADDIKLWGDNNLILYTNEIHLTTPDFKNRILSWDLPLNPENIERIKMNPDSSLYLIDLDSTQYSIYHIDQSSTASIVYSGKSLANEKIKDIKVLSDSTHLLIGQHEFEICNNSFLRTIHHEKEVEYKKCNVAISSFSILPQDTFIYSPDFDYIRAKAVAELFNNSEETVHSWDYFSTDYIRDAEDYLIYLSSSRSQPINLSEDIRDTISLDYVSGDYFGDMIDIADMRIEVPGANYRFNESPDRSKGVDILSSISQLTDTKIIQVYPNPSSDFISFNSDKNVRYSIINSLGRRISSTERNTDIGRINISSLEAGSYFLLLQDEENNYSIAQFIKK